MASGINEVAAKRQRTAIAVLSGVSRLHHRCRVLRRVGLSLDREMGANINGYADIF